MVKTLMGQIKQYKQASIMTPVFMAFEVLMEMLIPMIMSSIIDDGISKGNMQHIIVYGIIMLLVAMCSLFFGIQGGRYGAYASSGFAANIRLAMFKNIQTYSFSNIDKYSTAGLVTRLTTDVTNLQNAYQMILRMCSRSPLMLVTALVMCMTISVRLSLIFVTAIVFLGAALVFIVLTTMKVFDVVFKKYDDLNASVQENVSAIRVVKAYVREDHENKKFVQAAENLYKLFVKAEKRLAFNNPIMMIAVYGCILALSWFGAHMIVAGNLTTGELTALFSYVMNILVSLMMLSMVFVMITISLASAHRIAEVIDEQAEITNPAQPVMVVKDGSIDFDHVNFSYKHGSGEDTLTDISLHIHAGETIGIIGGTGSGKSSLVNLISRLYDTAEGCILVGGVDVRRYDLELIRNEVAVVLQKNVLFSGTIFENLRWGNKAASDEECIEACKMACADEFIERFPDKYNTYIEQGGNNVSGGQKQRLCIARALLKKPKVLILDDSTSAVDTATDSSIRAAFKTAISGTTKLIIAQRVSSVMDADRIIVMEDGRVNAFDTHEQLLKTNSIYQEVYDSQMNGGGDFDENVTVKGGDC